MNYIRIFTKEKKEEEEENHLVGTNHTRFPILNIFDSFNYLKNNASHKHKMIRVTFLRSQKSEVKVLKLTFLIQIPIFFMC